MLSFPCWVMGGGALGELVRVDFLLSEPLSIESSHDALVAPVPTATISTMPDSFACSHHPHRMVAVSSGVLICHTEARRLSQTTFT